MPRLDARPWEGKPSERRTNRPIARGPGARADPVCRTARPNDGPVLSLRRRHRVEMRSIPEPGMTRLRPAGRPAPPGGADRRTGLPRPFPAPRDGTAPDGSPFSPPGRSAGPTPARGAPPSSARKNRRRPEGSPASPGPAGRRSGCAGPEIVIADPPAQDIGPAARTCTRCTTVSGSIPLRIFLSTPYERVARATLPLC